MLDAAHCYQVLKARDRRFDGLFFVGVRTTGIYCRPICPARTPALYRCDFFTHAWLAEQQGFRACWRCRPELAPGYAPSDATSHLVRTAVMRIEQGCLNDNSVHHLAHELGVTSRHLGRLMERELGISPIALAQSLRLGLAKQLLQDTALPLAQVAFASGFQSVRRFNATFTARLGRAPSTFRLRAREATPSHVQLRLDYRPPFAWQEFLDFMRQRTLPGIEQMTSDGYERLVFIDGVADVICVAHDAAAHALRVLVPVTLVKHVGDITRRLRVLFDLDAQPHTIDAVLMKSKQLRHLVCQVPGLRLPGAFSAFEGCVRAVLGQQVSVRAAQTLVGRLIARFGQAVPGHGTLTHVFPSAKLLAELHVEQVALIGLPKARASTLLGLARAVHSGAVDLEAPAPQVLQQLTQLPGFGAWTRHYIAMRALHWPDAFPVGDLGLKKALGGVNNTSMERMAEAWQPFRAYATLHLWRSLSGDKQ